MNEKKHVFVAMSGGVDSAVCAARLLEQGYEVTGIHMSVWLDPKWREATEGLPSSAESARATAESLGIPFFNLDVQDKFYERVVQNFIRDYLEGLTPNPCLFCNPKVKWGILQSYALAQGGDYFATGHYARLAHQEDGSVRLLRGVDRTKDQSYVLSMLSQDQLKQSLLPLGSLTKTQVREQARALGLKAADRQDSQDLCFLGNVHYQDFLERFAPEASEPGEIVDTEGTVLGEHGGLAFYTIGQRKGIRIAAPEPYYVIAKEKVNNHLIVGFAEQAGERTLEAGQANWIAGEPPKLGKSYDVMIRYRAHPRPVRLLSVGKTDFRLEFRESVRGITPGQVAVLFDGETCLGGGVIHASA
ncbi:tRNA 2-thiouridine(34) synthase MnmA [bacterium]|nr:tRNA 2-thiouridine(34) synthase MnmA [bacterium]